MRSSTFVSTVSSIAGFTRANHPSAAATSNAATPSAFAIAAPGIVGGWTATAFRPSIDDNGVKTSGVQSFTTPVGADVTLIDLRGARYNVPPPGGPINLDD